MYSELMWGENYGDTIRVTLWWTFYLRSDPSPSRFRPPVAVLSRDTRETLQLHGDRRSACASGTDGRHAGGAAVASGRGSLRPRVARRTNQSRGRLSGTCP